MSEAGAIIEPDRDQALADIAAKLASTDLGRMPGKGLYSANSTLRPADLYVCGFNPGGNPKVERDCISGNFTLTREQNWSEYLDEKWALGRKTNYDAGKQPRQLKVQKFARFAGFDLRSTFCTNAIWARGIDVKQTRAGSSYHDLAMECVKIHRILLSIVRPRIILCFGRDAEEFFVSNGLCEVAGLARKAVGSNEPSAHCFYAPHFARGSNETFFDYARRLRELL